MNGNVSAYTWNLPIFFPVSDRKTESPIANIGIADVSILIPYDEPPYQWPNKDIK